MNLETIANIRILISQDNIENAISSLNNLLKNNKHLDEIIIQSARNHRIEKEIRQGVISWQDASITRNQITRALLDICRVIEDSLNAIPNNNGQISEGSSSPTPNAQILENQPHFLKQYPRGPMVDALLVSERIIEFYAKLIRPEQAMSYVNKANKIRREADSDGTIIEEYDLPPALKSSPIHFWIEVFTEARLHGPRMLVALLSVLSDDQFDHETKIAKIKLLNYLRTHK